MTESGELTDDEIDDVRRWAVNFNGERPSNGRFTDAIVAKIGQMPAQGEVARRVALEYFESKLPAAMTRYQHAIAAADPSSVPEDWFNAVDYWNAVIDWFEGLDEPHRAWKVPEPRWYYQRERVELNRDIEVDGRPLREGTQGVVLDGLEDDTLRRFGAGKRVAVMFSGNDLQVVPVFLLRYQQGADERPEATPPSSPGVEGCGHNWVRAGYRWEPVNPDRYGRRFASRYFCRICGGVKLEDFDEYSGRDLDIVHLRWRGSDW